jgi:hypothetical protein
MAENGVKGFLQATPIVCKLNGKSGRTTMATARTPGMPPFHYRNNADGTVDSICPLCFLTVARGKEANELRARELAHACDRFDPFRSKQN